jgi:prolyl oligopeptidase
VHAAYAAPATAPANGAPADAGPVAPADPVKDTYAGKTLTDNYRWMEGEPSAQFRDFLAASSNYADAQIGRIQGRAKLFADIEKFSVPYVAVTDVTPDGDTLFYLKRGPADDVARLMMRGGNTGDEHVLVDPETLPDAPPNSEIDQLAPSPDGNYVAYGLADQGPDSSVLRIYDTVRNRTLSERCRIARASTTRARSTAAPPAAASCISAYSFTGSTAIRPATRWCSTPNT